MNINKEIIALFKELWVDIINEEDEESYSYSFDLLFDNGARKFVVVCDKVADENKMYSFSVYNFIDLQDGKKECDMNNVINKINDYNKNAMYMKAYLKDENMIFIEYNGIASSSSIIQCIENIILVVSDIDYNAYDALINNI